MTETMSMASSRKSAKSKTERKLEKEIEKIKGNYGTIKSAIDVRLNDQNEFIDEMADMKNALDKVKLNFYLLGFSFLFSGVSGSSSSGLH